MHCHLVEIERRDGPLLPRSPLILLLFSGQHRGHPLQGHDHAQSFMHH